MPLPRAAAIAVLTPLVLLCSACRVERNPVPETLNVDSASRADIRATLQAYRLARIAGDANLAASFFAPDARLYQPGAAEVRGSDAVEGAMAGFFAEGGVVTEVALHSEDLHVDGPLAFEFGTYEERFRLGEAGERSVRGHYAIRWRRAPEARWWIERFLLNGHPPDTTIVPADTTVAAAAQ